MMREQTRSLCTSWTDICSGGSQKSYNPLDKHNIRLGFRCRRLSSARRSCVLTVDIGCVPYCRWVEGRKTRIQKRSRKLFFDQQTIFYDINAQGKTFRP